MCLSRVPLAPASGYCQGSMEGALTSACVQLCETDPVAARSACKVLLAMGSQPLQEAPSRFDQILAPVLARLSERPLPCLGLMEDVLKLLLVLLEGGDPAVLPTSKLQRVFPLVCERLMGLLEELRGKTSTRSGAQAEEMTLQILQSAQVLIVRWCLDSF